MKQLSFFPEENKDPRPPIRFNWNLWHGCTKKSPGCMHCYMYRRDESIGKDPSILYKTEKFDAPIRILKSGKNKGRYKIPYGSQIDTCFSSDFFHKDADIWRDDAWNIIRERNDCTFFMITKRPERMAEHLPSDWCESFSHVTIAVTCENQEMIDQRLPIYLSLPLFNHIIAIEPMLTEVDLTPYIKQYRLPDGTPTIKQVTVGGESGANARVCDFAWVEALHAQCVANDIAFYYHQTGAKLKKDGKLYNIPRKQQHIQAKKAGLDT